LCATTFHSHFIQEKWLNQYSCLEEDSCHLLHKDQLVEVQQRMKLLKKHLSDQAHKMEEMNNRMIRENVFSLELTNIQISMF